MKRDKSLEDQLYLIGWIFLAAGSIFFWIYFRWIASGRGIGCVWDRFLGIYCPGCGGTRAVWALLQGDLLHALWYHPLVPYSAVMFGSFMISQTIAKATRRRYIKGMRFHNWYLYAAVAILAVNFIAKNLLRYIWHVTL